MKIDLPPCRTAPPRRQPTAAYRIRWHHPSWRSGIDGRPAWKSAWYVRATSGRRRVRRLIDAGHTVEMDVYRLNHVRSVRWDLDDEVPF